MKLARTTLVLSLVLAAAGVKGLPKVADILGGGEFGRGRFRSQTSRPVIERPNVLAELNLQRGDGHVASPLERLRARLGKKLQGRGTHVAGAAQDAVHQGLSVATNIRKRVGDRIGRISVGRLEALRSRLPRLNGNVGSLKLGDAVSDLRHRMPILDDKLGSLRFRERLEMLRNRVPRLAGGSLKGRVEDVRQRWVDFRPLVGSGRRQLGALEGRVGRVKRGGRWTNNGPESFIPLDGGDVAVEPTESGNKVLGLKFGGFGDGMLNRRAGRRGGRLFASQLKGGGLKIGGLREGGLKLGGLRKGGLKLGGLRKGGLKLGGLRKDGLKLGGLRNGGLKLGGLRKDGFKLGGLRKVDGLRGFGRKRESGSPKEGLFDGLKSRGGRLSGIRGQSQFLKKARGSGKIGSQLGNLKVDASTMAAVASGVSAGVNLLMAAQNRKLSGGRRLVGVPPSPMLSMIRAAPMQTASKKNARLGDIVEGKIVRLDKLVDRKGSRLDALIDVKLGAGGIGGRLAKLPKLTSRVPRFGKGKLGWLDGKLTRLGGKLPKFGRGRLGKLNGKLLRLDGELFKGRLGSLKAAGISDRIGRVGDKLRRKIDRSGLKLNLKFDRKENKLFKRITGNKKTIFQTTAADSFGISGTSTVTPTSTTVSTTTSSTTIAPTTTTSTSTSTTSRITTTASPSSSTSTTALTTTSSSSSTTAPTTTSSSTSTTAPTTTTSTGTSTTAPTTTTSPNASTSTKAPATTTTSTAASTTTTRDSATTTRTANSSSTTRASSSSGRASSSTTTSTRSTSSATSSTTTRTATTTTTNRSPTISTTTTTSSGTSSTTTGPSTTSRTSIAINENNEFDIKEHLFGAFE
eukprot:GHVS01104883.1.p1 GENE.GHVS01104883.1~~GHVS01104883.1.p1  ORF type:complete len:855 (-),score=145.53 GHVS01104883.1:374-2938(-)